MSILPPSPTASPADRAARVAVAVVFCTNGAAFANWVPRIPEVKAALDLGTGALGAALLGTGAGALLASLVAGTIVGRAGSRRTTVVSGLLMCAALPLIGVAGSWAALLAALALLGALDALTDIAMNAHGVVVERGYGRSIMHGLHAWWSVGAVLGALTGSAAAAAGHTLVSHLAVTGGILAVVIAVSGWFLLPGSTDRLDVGMKAGRVPVRAMGFLPVAAILAAVAEGAPGDWSAVYLSTGLEVRAGAAGLAFAAFSATMLATRLVGDRAVDRWGVARTLRATIGIGAAGLAAGLFVQHPVAAIAGFALYGVGLALVHPALYAGAGTVPGIPAGAGIAMMTLTSRLGFLVGPPLIGGVAGVVSLRAGLLLAIAAAAGVAVLARAVTPAASTRARP